MTMETQERIGSFFRFEDLRVYAKATDYSSWLMANLRNPDNEMQRSLATAFCRSSFDIALNIAEGSSRSKGQFEHYLKISKTAIRECVVFTSVANARGLLDDTQREQSRTMLMELTRMIGALIISLQRGGGRRPDEERYDEPEPESDEPLDALDRIDTNF